MTPPDLQVKATVARADYLVTIGVWPGMRSLDVNGWLSNFASEERGHACALLNHLLYYSNDLTKALLASSFANLSSLRQLATDDGNLIKCNWKRFRENLIITWVEGERPGPTDSGLIFARLAKQTLGIREQQIMSPDAALRSAWATKNPVVFVDDFVGSGQQMEKTWSRIREMAQDINSSFLREQQDSDLDVSYIPCIATSRGVDHLARHSPGLKVAPAHVLSTRESVFAPDSSAWPDELLPTAVDFLESCSRRAGIPEERWKGYCDLGLTLAFEHSIPDATLPLLTHESATWRPLIRNA